ncbi:MAG: LacI family DNA-binding transcriptional regulator [Microlunatus sp.]
MKDVAALAGVSLGTVSNVVNSPQLVSEATRTKVEVAITKLGWVPNESARQLRAGRSRSIGMVVMDISNPFFADVLAGAETAVYQHGYTLQIGNSRSEPSREGEQLLLFEQQRVRGILYTPVEAMNDRVAQLRYRNIPVVIVDRAGDGSGYCSVSVDDVEGGRLAAEHLIAQGHRAIAVVGGPASLQQVRDRRLGVDIARAQQGDPVQVVTITTEAMDAAAGVAAAEQIVALPALDRPTGVFATNDLLAIGLLQGFVTQGLRIPQDVAIIGYDDISFAASAAVPLSSIRQPREALGRRAAELLFDEIAAADDNSGHEHRSVRFTPELVVRRSSKLSL